MDGYIRDNAPSEGYSRCTYIKTVGVERIVENLKINLLLTPL
jgi:hypothetical protein